MSRTRTSLLVWAVVLVAAAAVHAAGLTLCTGGDRPRSPAEEVGALFERQYVQLRADNHEALWPSLSAPFREGIIKIESGIPAAREVNLRNWAALDPWDSSVEVDAYPDIDLSRYVIMFWDGTMAYQVEIAGRAARVVYSTSGDHRCEQPYTRVGETWYLDGGQGCSDMLPTFEQALEFGRGGTGRTRASD